ncbi:MAG: low temperature requirement protein A [Candidatus Limnocylindria bacterium]
MGDELVIAHPIGQADVATLATVLGGPALFLAGHALFRYTVIGVRSGSRLVAIALLVGLIPVANRVVAARHRAGGDAGGGRRAIHESVFHPASTAESISVEGA